MQRCRPFPPCANCTTSAPLGGEREKGHGKFVQMVMFMKNIATMGGLLADAGFGSGPLAVDKAYGVD